MKRVRRWSRVLAPLFAVGIFAAGSPSRGEDEIVNPSAADCTFQADQLRSAPEMWHRLSQRAEAVAHQPEPLGRADLLRVRAEVVGPDVLDLVRPRLAVLYHFFNDFDTGDDLDLPKSIR